MKILLVHDSIEKVEAIKNTLLHFSPDITLVDNIADARNENAKVTFDYILLDMVLPKRKHEEPVKDAGYDFLCELELGEKWMKMPKEIICISDYSDIRNELKEMILKKTFSFIDTQEADWCNELNLMIRSFEKRKSRAENLPIYEQFDFCILTALEKEISPFIKIMKLEKYERNGDPIIYYSGEIKSSSDKIYKIIFCSLNKMGLVVTSILATKVITNFTPRYLIMSGICGGVGNDVNLGDLIIATGTVDYSSGKIIEENGRIDFLHSPSGAGEAISPTLNQKIAGLVENKNYVLEALKYVDKTEVQVIPRVHQGPIASGPCVVASPQIVAKIKLIERKIAGIDMEALALFASREYFDNEHAPEVLVVKAVSDRADQEKDDKYHPFCCSVSAGYIITLIKNNFFEV